MKIFDVTVPKKYIKNGAEKTSWSNVGKLIKFDALGEKPEGFILELNMFPDVKFGVFEQKPRNDQNYGVGSQNSNSYGSAPQNSPSESTQAQETVVVDENGEIIPF